MDSHVFGFNQSACTELNYNWDIENSVCSVTFLRNAVEINQDGIGNDDVMCTSGETCLYTPNIGAYQGHGNLISAGPFTDGVLTGITLVKHETNGY